ncbi:ChbG/HpnK family deacetylase [Vibrio tapetis subsp. quintayensis]|uniref:ChbG/HpnK family deacetylase n=1 Tax=Vibrio tapetis TaxID=52443 RepID=UPI0025B62890|nr:ChbG/HpnK family deacetylase [Vibrio tapetis]MDN3679775.1 ChbG/HpnK family deacetylase [Vibrio tapetis subsp. quintayensis]
MKNLIICADDFAMSAEVDTAIIDLLEHKRISATSCMTLMPNWQHSAQQLKPYQSDAALGLHFDLGHIDSLGTLMLNALTRRSDKQTLLSTLQAQLDNYEDALNQAPDYLDGHQHVHAFPQIRDVVLNELSRRYSDGKIWVRDPSVPLSGHDSAIKAVAIQLLNLGFKQKIQGHNLKHNNGFAGLYSICEQADFSGMMEGWLQSLPHQGLIMCHPATKGADVEHAAARSQEYNYLMSDRYRDFLLKQDIHLTHFK